MKSRQSEVQVSIWCSDFFYSLACEATSSTANLYNADAIEHGTLRFDLSANPDDQLIEYSTLMAEWTAGKIA